MQAENDTIISLSELSVTYGEKRVLNKLNLTFKRGEFVAILGKSGSGKTTLLNSIANFIPFEGKVDKMGKVGFCFQNHALFFWMTTRQNIGFGVRETAQAKQKLVDEVIRKIGLRGYEDRYPSELSGGEQQRVALGRAIATNPSILLLDEPFSSLDLFTRDQMINWMLMLTHEVEATILMVTHYLDEALVLADRIIVLSDGKIYADYPSPLPRPRGVGIRFDNAFLEAKQVLHDTVNMSIIGQGAMGFGSLGSD